jgi:hypothetical protein
MYAVLALLADMIQLPACRIALTATTALAFACTAVAEAACGAAAAVKRTAQLLLLLLLTSSY